MPMGSCIEGGQGFHEGTSILVCLSASTNQSAPPPPHGGDPPQDRGPLPYPHPPPHRGPVSAPVIIAIVCVIVIILVVAAVVTYVDLDETRIDLLVEVYDSESGLGVSDHDVSITVFNEDSTHRFSRELKTNEIGIASFNFIITESGNYIVQASTYSESLDVLVFSEDVPFEIHNRMNDRRINILLLV